MCRLFKNNNREEFKGKVQFIMLEVQVPQGRDMIKENKRLN